MGKIICEICGTAYSDAENECPVCGFEKPETAEFAPDEMVAYSSGRTGRASGGRFLKNNPAAVNKAPKPKSKRKSSKKSGSDIGLLIAVLLLLLSVICFGAYIYFRYFNVPTPPPVDTKPVETTTQPTVQTTTQPTETTTVPVDLSCTGLTLYEQSVVLNQVGSEWLLNVVPTPANTTDEITYESADQNVATVSADGKIVAVGSGETVITVTCGSVKVECKVLCDIPVETTIDMSDFKFRKVDITFDKKGQTFLLYDGKIDVKEITWTIGNSDIATIKDGVVRAVSEGTTNAYGEYNGVKLKCIVRCDFD